MRCPNCDYENVTGAAHCNKCGGAVPSAPPPGRPAFLKPERVRVVVTDVELPFGSMVTLLVKLALAAIPAAIIVALVWLFIAAAFAGLGG